MKKLYKILMAILALSMPVCIYAQGDSDGYTDFSWVIAFVGESDNDIDLYYCYSTAEVGANDKMYGRITYLTEINPFSAYIKTSYGLRHENKCIYVYDYEKNTETLAFDFNLSVGDRFTTYNGMKWIVEEARDTLIKDPVYGGSTIDAMRRLLKVRSEDGMICDTWLEGFGSFKNHLMIVPMTAENIRETLWQYDYDFYIAREISCDPIYTYDAGWLGGTFDEGDCRHDTTMVYNNGVLTIDVYVYRWPSRYYRCFFRDGNDIYSVKAWEFQPHIDYGNRMYYTDTFSFPGLPETDEGYRVHWGNGVVTGIKEVPADGAKRVEGGIYDLQGRKLPREPRKGIYIKDGKVTAGKEAR